MKLVIDFSKESDKRRLYGELKRLKQTSYLIELKKYRDNRSNNQNAYYWGVVLKILSDFTGFEPDEMHEVLKAKFIKPKQRELPNGEIVDLPVSTKDLNTEEFENYLGLVRRFADIELHCIIPLPNEV